MKSGLQSFDDFKYPGSNRLQAALRQERKIKINNSSPRDPLFPYVSGLIIVEGDTIQEKTSKQLTINAVVDNDLYLGSKTIFFNGGAYLSLPNEGFNLNGVNSFTIELFVNYSHTDNSNSYNLFGKIGYFQSYKLSLDKIDFSTYLSFYWNGSLLLRDVGDVVTPLEWHHIAVCKEENQFTLNLDGNVIATNSTFEPNLNDAGDYFQVGYASDWYTTESLLGYLYGLRFTNGACRYFSDSYEVPTGFPARGYL